MSNFILMEAAIEAAIDGADEWDGGGHNSAREACIRSALLSIPAADVRPVVRARWKARGDSGVTECPACRWSIEECIDYNFCPNCGADMRGTADA